MRLRLLFPIAFGALAVAMPGATASANTTLAITGFSHMLVDGAHNHVFVTGSSSDSAVKVLNADGTPAASISGESGAGGMVLSGNTLYVARCGWGVIDEIDASTLTKVGSFSAAVGGTCDLSLAGGRLWYSNSTDQQFGDLVSVSLDSSHTEIDSGRNFYQAIFATTPVHPNWLVVGESEQSPTVAYVEDVADPSSVLQLTYKFDLGGEGNLGDMTITPDGSTLLVAAGGPYEMDAFSLPSLSAAGVYPTDPYPNSVAVSPSGAKLASGSDSDYSYDVFAFDSGNATATRRVDFGNTTFLFYPRGLALSPDGTELYAVTRSGTSAPVFRVLSVLPPASLTIRASAGTVTFGKSATLTVHLGSASTNRTVSIYRRPVTAATPVLLHTGTVGAAGSLTFAVRPGVDTIYTVRWSGDSAHGPTTSAPARVNVRVVMHRQTVGGYATSRGVRLYHFTAACERAPHTGCPSFLAWAAPVQPGRRITYVGQGRTTGGRWVTIFEGAGIAASNGRLCLTVYYTSSGLIGVPQRIRFSIASSTSVVGSTSAWLPFRVTR